jgi:uncharacterized membrane protein
LRACGAPAGQAAATAATPAASGMTTNNMAAALAYLAGLITVILFLVIDPYKGDRLVRFHAFQSLFFNIAWIGFWIAWAVLGLVLSAVTKGIFFLIQTPNRPGADAGRLCGGARKRPSANTYKRGRRSGDG